MTLAFPTKFDQPHPISRAMSDPKPLHLATIDEAYIINSIADPARREAWRLVNIRSMIVAPMMVGGRRLGALTMLRTLSDRAFEASDVRVVEEVARRAAVAVENIRLTEAARREFSAREVQFRVIADSMPMLMWTTNPEGVTEWHNRRWHEYTGRPEDSPVDVGWRTLHPEDIEPTRLAWVAATGTAPAPTFTKRGARSARCKSSPNWGRRCRRRSKCKPRWMLRCTWSFPNSPIGRSSISSMKTATYGSPRSTIATSESGRRSPTKLGTSMRVRARSSRKWASPQRSSRR
jgi:PAS domain-containing protein